MQPMRTRGRTDSTRRERERERERERYTRTHREKLSGEWRGDDEAVSLSLSLSLCVCVGARRQWRGRNRNRRGDDRTTDRPPFPTSLTSIERRKERQTENAFQLAEGGGDVGEDEDEARLWSEDGGRGRSIASSRGSVPKILGRPAHEFEPHSGLTYNEIFVCAYFEAVLWGNGTE